MRSTLDREPVAGLLEAMYRDAVEQQNRPDRPRAPQRDADEPFTTEAAAALSAEMADLYLPISPVAGRLLYSLIRAARPATVVEFGMSFGISTLHLAAAVRDNGTGHVYTTELTQKKIDAGRQTFTQAGLDDVITVLEGDALTTLTTIDADIDFVLRDGWKPMYAPVLELIEPRLASGTIVVADNADSPDLADYLARVRDPDNGYVSLNFPGKEHDTMELSCRV